MFDRTIEKYLDAEPIFHGDRGLQYTKNSLKSRINNAGMAQSMSGVGKCIDDGPME